MSAAAVYVEAATPEDLDALVALEQQAATHPWTRQGFEGAIRGGAGERVAVLREVPGVLVGYCVWQEVADEAHVHNVAIAPRRRRQGLGRRLLAACLGLAARRGARRAFLDVRASNQAALTLYAGLGFRESARRRAYYSGPAEDAVVMEVSLEANGILKSGERKC
ncbi:MAG TPA: ribosomal protein S18-alanine N-acetyltransferase [Vicinamibacteria bacterium]|nr:ribosomal protein S18-alanine N-acetyltransferase [Vicinamibacteria bacterium]